jgi:Flp pilus assembly pilin Flp
MKDFLARFVRNDDGQDLIEYGLLAGIITALTVTAIQAIGPKVQDYIQDLNAMLPAAD